MNKHESTITEDKFQLPRTSEVPEKISFVNETIREVAEDVQQVTIF